MAFTARHDRPTWVRVSSRAAGLVGVRFYNMLYGERSLVDAVPRVEPPPGLSIRWAGDRDLERMAVELAPRQVESCRLAVTQRSRCLLASIGDEIAGYCWLNTADIYLLRWKVQALPAEGGYTYNSLVRPQHRGNKIFQCLTQAAYSELEREGFRFCCNLVDRDNAPSLAARQRLGALFCRAPILKLPGLGPVPLRRFPFGVSLEEPQNR